MRTPNELTENQLKDLEASKLALANLDETKPQLTAQTPLDEGEIKDAEFSKTFLTHYGGGWRCGFYNTPVLLHFDNPDHQNYYEQGFEDGKKTAARAKIEKRLARS